MNTLLQVRTNVFYSKKEKKDKKEKDEFVRFNEIVLFGERNLANLYTIKSMYPWGIGRFDINRISQWRIRNFECMTECSCSD